MKNRFNLKYKLILLTLISIILSILLVGAGVNFFLIKLHKRVAKEVILQSFDLLSKEFREIEQKMLHNLHILTNRNDVISFLDTISKNQIVEKNQSIIFNNEKKTVASELLEQIKMDLNNIVAIYDINGLLNSFIIKENSDYKMGILSRENEKCIIYTSTTKSQAKQKWQISKLPSILNLKEKSVNELDNFSYRSGEIKYKRVANNLAIEANKLIIKRCPDDTSKSIGFIKIVNFIDMDFFKNISQKAKLNFSFSINGESPIGVLKDSEFLDEMKYSKFLFSKREIENIEIIENDKYLLSSYSLALENRDIVYFISGFNKEVLNYYIGKSRDILYIILIISAIIVIFVSITFANETISKPIKVLVNNLEALKVGNYKGIKEINSNDEIGDLSNSFKQMVETIQKREEELTEHINFETLIATISKNFISSNGGLKLKLNHILELIGKFANADRSYIFLYSLDKRAMSNTNEWCNKNIIPQIDNLQNIPVNKLKWFNEELKKNELFLVEDVANLPKEARREKKHFLAQNIASLACVPFIYNQELKGFIGLDIVNKKREISKQHIRLLKTVGEIIINAIERENAKKELQKYKDELELRVQNEIDKRREQEQLLIQQSKLAGMGEMIGNIAHQWRQPLNALGLKLQDIAEAYEYGDLNEEYINKTVDSSMDIIDRMSHTIEDFRNFFKPNKQKINFSVKKAIEDSLSVIEASLKNNFIELIFNVKEDVSIYGFPSEYSQVILNILNNAKDALKNRDFKEKKIWIEIEKKETKSIVKIIDNAGGIKECIIDKIFEPYFTTKHQSEGTGIGLYMSKMIIERNMHGKIEVQNKNGGAIFIIEV